MVVEGDLKSNNQYFNENEGELKNGVFAALFRTLLKEICSRNKKIRAMKRNNRETFSNPTPLD